jgi:GTP-binding protein HflX
LIEREAPVTRAVVFHPVTRMQLDRADARLAEATGLAEALDLEVVETGILPMRKIESGQYFGSGKVGELAERIKEMDATVAVIDAALSPVQQRNLEKAWNAKVIDRTGLILEIFGQRARTKEGVLQVELARLAYERSRLVRTWTHLERQRGGGGFLAGPGETQIETDRRLLADKMSKLRRQLDEVRRTRGLHRKKRKDIPYPTIALVGYTNAGKSTLFNYLTGAKVFAKDMPFATLDPTVRGLKLPNGTEILLSDTVGFITDLPTELIAAFRATLEEVREADLLLHVIDAADPDCAGRIRDVEDVLDAIEAGPRHDQDMVEVWNKVDALDEDGLADVETGIMIANAKAQKTVRLQASALTGAGMSELLTAVETAMAANSDILVLSLPPQEGRALAWLHQHGEALSEEADPETGVIAGRYRMPQGQAGRFQANFPHLMDVPADSEDL